jgi:hypothetical protein
MCIFRYCWLFPANHSIGGVSLLPPAPFSAWVIRAGDMPQRISSTNEAGQATASRAGDRRRSRPVSDRQSPRSRAVKQLARLPTREEIPDAGHVLHRHVQTAARDADVGVPRGVTHFRRRPTAIAIAPSGSCSATKKRQQAARTQIPRISSLADGFPGRAETSCGPQVPASAAEPK